MKPISITLLHCFACSADSIPHNGQNEAPVPMNLDGVEGSSDSEARGCIPYSDLTPCACCDALASR